MTSPSSNQDTIVAIATAPGRGGVGIVRISGPLAADDLAGAVELEEGGALEPMSPPR